MAHIDTGRIVRIVAVGSHEMEIAVVGINKGNSNLKEITVRVCIPTKTNNGFGAEVSPHFGSAPFFTVYDVEEGSLEFVKNEHERHEHGKCVPTGMVQKLKNQCRDFIGYRAGRPPSAQSKRGQSLQNSGQNSRRNR